MKKLFYFSATFFVALYASCSDEADLFIETSLNSDVKKFSELSNVDSNFDIVDILSTQNDSAKSDLSDKKDLLDNYSPVENIISTEETNKVINISDALSNTLDANRDLEAEAALKKLEENVNEHQKSINNLRKINLTKDQTIASLSTINDELLNEIKRIKSMNKVEQNKISDVDASSYSQIDLLKKEVMKLKNTLILKSKELDNLRSQNNSLEGRISELEVSPKVKELNTPSNDFLYGFNREPISSSYNQKLSTKGDDSYSPRSYTSVSGTCSLEFDAVVTSLSGRNKEAFFTEFFILPYSLESILQNADFSISNYKGVSSFAELWAKSCENPFLYPNSQKEIRSTLLDLVEGGEGKRVRTDVDGFAKVSGINVGNYFIIGTATLGKVGVTWNVPVTLKSGGNKVSLTLENSAWSL